MRWACCLVLSFAAATAAQAHDSWLSPSREPSPSGRLALELATGNRYPVQEFGSSTGSLAQAACRDPSGGSYTLRPVREQAKRLDLEAAHASALACWLELKTAEIEIDPARVAVYLAEIKASASVRSLWSAQLAEGVPWRETYRKFARIELAGDAKEATLLAARRPVGLDLELVVLGGEPIRPNEPAAFQLLRDGKPLAGQAVEFVSERSAIGVWRETGTDGRLKLALPFAGRWLLRATDLRPSLERPGQWDSRFVTLAIEARAAPKGN